MNQPALIKARDLAARLNLALAGDGEVALGAVSSLREAQAGDLAFVANPRYLPEVAHTKASAVIVPADFAGASAAACLLKADDPDAAFAAACQLFAPPPVGYPAGVHPTAVVAPDVQLGRDVSIGPHCVLEAGVRVGDRTVLCASVYLGHGVQVGGDCLFYPHASVRDRCLIGERVILHNGVVVGSDGFGYTVDAQGIRTKIPQTGIVVLEDDVEIGANTTIDRARFGRTRVGKGTKIDNLVQIAHNVTIGEHSVMCAQVGISGSTHIGKHVILAGQVGLAGHLEIGDGVIIGAQAGVSKDIMERGMYLGAPAVPKMDFARNLAHVDSIPKLKARLAALEKKLADLESKAG